MICASLRSFKSCSLCIASLRGPPIGGQDNDEVSLLCSAPYTLLPLRGISPQGETRNLRRKTESHILHVPLRHSPFGGWRHHLARWEACHWILSRLRLLTNPVPLPPPQAGALWVLSHGAMSLQESIERPILPPEQGWQGNTIRKGAKRPENRVTRFPVEKSGTAGKGEASAASQSAECLS